MKRSLLTLTALLVGAANVATAAPRLDPKAITAEGMKQFGFTLLQKAYAGRQKDPIAISPFSISEALVLATSGAEKETNQQMCSVFLTPAILQQGASSGLLVEGVSSLRRDLTDYAKRSKDAFVFTSANSLVGNSNSNVQFRYDPAFKQLAAEKFGASVVDYDFMDPATLGKVNAWVDTETQGKIKELIKELKPEDAAILLNAVYSRGKFAKHFHSLSEGTFTNSAGDKSTVTYMSQRGGMPYIQDGDVRMVSLSIGDSPGKPGAVPSEVALDILAPAAGSDLDALVAALDGKTYSELLAKLKPETLALRIPASKLEQKEALSLRPILENAPFNVTRPFNEDEAQFGHMGSVVSEANLYVRDVLTKTFYEVTPLGFEAAAATAVLMATRTSAGPQPVAFDVEGPSIHVIRHIPTGTPLFLSIVDSGVKYDEARLVEMIEIGAKATRNISAKVADGTLTVIYTDRAFKEKSIAVVDDDGNTVRVIKKI